MKDFSKLQSKLQYLGGSMMIPIILLVVCGFCMGIGSPLANFILTKGSILHTIAVLFMRIGGMIMGNLPVWFSIGLAFGLTKENKGWAALIAVFMLFSINNTIQTLLSMKGITAATCNVDGFVALGYTIEQAKIQIPMYRTVAGFFTYDMSIFVALIVGGLTSFLMNHYGNVKLPDMLGFFAGPKFVVVLTPLFAVPVGALLFFLWPYVNVGIQSLSTFMATSGLVGTFVNRILDRCLLPFGMHHLINFPLFYSALGGSMTIDGVLYNGTAEIGQALVASPTATTFLVRNWNQGKNIINIAGWSGAMLAMYHTALPENRKKVLAIMIPALFTAAVVGVTEPMEFTILFANPLLYYLVHVPLAGCAAVLSEAMHVSLDGDALVFMTSNLLQPQKVHAMPLLFLYPLFFCLYYFIFKWFILKFNVMTPGRKKEESVRFASKTEIKEYKTGANETTDSKFTEGVDFAQSIVDCFGGADNITTVENCLSRLRVTVKDASLVVAKDVWINDLQAMGVVITGNNFQIIYGPRVNKIATDVRKVLGR